MWKWLVKRSRCRAVAAPVRVDARPQKNEAEEEMLTQRSREKTGERAFWRRCEIFVDVYDERWYGGSGILPDRRYRRRYCR